ncbi:MAG: hypothetical protein IJW66_04585 [Clostridia bacterium]|nr:hypothetical protein [Clostridia bacterium]
MSDKEKNRKKTFTCFLVIEISSIILTLIVVHAVSFYKFEEVLGEAVIPTAMTLIICNTFIMISVIICNTILALKRYQIIYSASKNDEDFQSKIIELIKK